MQTQTYHAATAPRLTFAPLATARGLQERGVTSVAVLEAQTIGHGASGRNGGFVFGGYSRDAVDLVNDLGLREAREFYAHSREAVALIRSRIDRHAIDCDRQEGGALLLNWFRHSARAERQFRDQARWPTCSRSFRSWPPCVSRTPGVA
jgi:gamma-glutamylputrescine oxidase